VGERFFPSDEIFSAKNEKNRRSDKNSLRSDALTRRHSTKRFREKSLADRPKNLE
jgi:hypothetical protein